MPAEDLCLRPAHEIAGLVARGELSARQLVEAHLERIEAVDPLVNAVVTRVPERALEWADEADARQARGEPLGPLHGLPIAHKDLVMTAGIRTTLGTKTMADHVPAADDLIVTRLRAAGAITVGKTNVPEFGAGSHTFNDVFGVTRNPWNPAKTCGGSSGGAAVALATGMVPIADGSDLGGSLRNPANFCNVVGLRPSLGRVPAYPAAHGWTGLETLGPMGRTVADVALLLAAIAGPDPRAPASLETPGRRFLAPLDRDFSGVRVAWSDDLGGLPVEPEVTQALQAGVRVLESLGCVVERAELDWEGAQEAFQTLRAWSFAHRTEGLPPAVFDTFKDTVRWNIERGRALSGADVARAEALRTSLYQRLRESMERYAFLALPVNQVVPFDVECEYPTEVAGVAMETYVDWMMSACYVSVTGHPAISVPCAFTADALPVGLQLVGRHRDDFGVLQLARAFEQANPLWRRRPPVLEGAPEP